MAIISFWNDGKKEIGQTVAIAAIATQLALNTNYKVLLFNTKQNSLTFTECFWPAENSKINFQDKGKTTDIGSGISGLTQAILSNKTSPEIITNYTKTIFKNKLELLTDKTTTDEEYKKEKNLFKEMIKMANKYYDLVLVDINGDIEDSFVSSILGESNIVVVTLTQSLRLLNQYVELRTGNELIGSNKKMVMIGRYDKKSKYNVKNIERYIGEKEVYGIPYNTQFFEACNEGEVAEYFIKFRKVRETDPNSFFIESVRKMAGDIVEKIKILQTQIYG